MGEESRHTEDHPPQLQAPASSPTLGPCLACRKPCTCTSCVLQPAPVVMGPRYETASHLGLRPPWRRQEAQDQTIATRPTTGTERGFPPPKAALSFRRGRSPTCFPSRLRMAGSVRLVLLLERYLTGHVWEPMEAQRAEQLYQTGCSAQDETRCDGRGAICTSLPRFKS